MKKVILSLVMMSSASSFAEDVRRVSYIASRGSCATATTVAINKCLSGDYWGAVRLGEVRKLNVEVASENQVGNGLCEVKINCDFRFH